jgi:hypothetical protein
MLDNIICKFTFHFNETGGWNLFYEKSNNSRSLPTNSTNGSHQSLVVGKKKTESKYTVFLYILALGPFNTTRPHPQSENFYHKERRKIKTTQKNKKWRKKMLCGDILMQDLTKYCQLFAYNSIIASINLALRYFLAVPNEEAKIKSEKTYPNSLESRYKLYSIFIDSRDKLKKKFNGRT